MNEKQMTQLLDSMLSSFSNNLLAIGYVSSKFNDLSEREFLKKVEEYSDVFRKLRKEG